MRFVRAKLICASTAAYFKELHNGRYQSVSNKRLLMNERLNYAARHKEIDIIAMKFVKITLARKLG